MLRLLNTGRQVMPPVTKYKDLKIERVLDYDDRTLSFSIPVNVMPVDMMLENYIQTQEDEYVIKQITLNGNYYYITAQLNIDELEGTHWETFYTTEQTVQQTANLALAGTGWTCVCDISKKRSIKKTNVYTWDILKQIVKTYRLEMIIDSLNKNIKFVEKRGEDKGVYFSSQLNLRSVGKQAQTADFYTRIIPVGKDGLTIEAINGGKKYLENHTYSSKNKTYYWKDERYTNASNLKEDAEAKLTDMATPRISYSCDIIDLAKANNYSFLSYGLGDVVTIIDSATNIRVTQRIVKMIEYPESPERNQCEISNTKLSFEELTQKYEDTTDTVNNITTDNGTIDSNAIDTIPASKVVIANSAEFKNVETEILNVTDMLTAANAKIGTLETTKLTATTAELTYAKIDTLEAVTGRIEILEANSLTATSAEIKSLTAGVANINTLMFGTASGGSLTTEFSNSVVGLIGDAQIKSAMIKDISADKILSGKLYTNLVQICSQSGNLGISDNTIQIRDNNKKVRVQIGKDASSDYNIYIWDKGGNLMFDPLYGVQESGIKKAIIRNDMISNTANISGEKIDISSLITTINKDGSNTINASKVYIDTDKQTLDVSFKNLTTSISTVTTNVTTAVNTANTANATANSAKSTATTANTTANTAKTTADAAKQTATTANNTANTANGNANSALSKANTLETNLKTITEKVTTQGTQITAIQGNISSKIWQQDITTAVTSLEIGGRNLVRNGNFSNSTSTSGYWNNWGSPSIREFVTLNGKKWCHIKGTGTAQYQGINQNTGIRIEKDTQYTISIRVKGAKDNQIFAIGVHWNSTSTIIAQSWKYPTVGTTDKIVTATFRTPNTDVNHFNLMLGVSSTTTVYEVYFTDIKLEKGNKATDWTPAPEDVDSSITNLESNTKTLSTQYTSLNQTLTSLSATVNSNTTKINAKADGSTVTSLQTKVTNIQTDLNGYKTTVTNTYATKSSLNDYATTKAVSTAIDQKADSIIQTVSATYTTKTDFNNMQIGGRNLLLNTNKGVDGWRWTANGGVQSLTEYNSGTYSVKCVQAIIKTPSTGYCILLFGNINRNKLQANKQYTLTFDIYSSTTGKTDICYAQDTRAQNCGWFGTCNYKAQTWVHFVGTVTFNSTNPNQNQYLYFADINVARSWIIANLKLEEGNKSTAYSAAPEDTDALINTLQSNVTSIQADLSGYKTTVANTYATKNTLNGYATTTALNSAIDQKANSIIQSVSATYATKTDFNNMQIGGRNFILNSTFATQGTSWVTNSSKVTYATDSTVGNYIMFYCTAVGDNLNYRIYQTPFADGKGHVQGQQYTLSFYAKASESSAKINCGCAGNLQAVTVGTTWSKYTIKYTASNTSSLMFNIAKANVKLYLSQIKLEKGNRATDWSPAPEDTNKYVNAKLELKIDKAKLVSEINASADEINLKSNRLSWTSTGTSMTKEGNLTCTTGKIGGFNITSTGINATSGTVGINSTGGWALHAGALIKNTDRYAFCVGHEGNVYSNGSAYFNGSANFNGVTNANGEFYVTTSRYGQCAVALTAPGQSIKLAYDQANKNLIFFLNGIQIANVYGA